MEEINGHNSPSRLDRIERIVEVLANRQAFVEEHFIKLIAAQTTTETRLQQLAGRMDELAAAQKHTDERMDALIAVVDGLVTGRKPNETPLP